MLIYIINYIEFSLERVLIHSEVMDTSVTIILNSVWSGVSLKQCYGLFQIVKYKSYFNYILLQSVSSINTKNIIHSPSLTMHTNYSNRVIDFNQVLGWEQLSTRSCSCIRHGFISLLRCQARHAPYTLGLTANYH